MEYLELPVAVGKLLNLNREQMVNAIGLAGVQSAGLTEFLESGDMSKRLNPGKASFGGLLSALLAKKGFTGPRTISKARMVFGEHSVIHARLNQICFC